MSAHSSFINAVLQIANAVLPTPDALNKSCTALHPLAFAIISKAMRWFYSKSLSIGSATSNRAPNKQLFHLIFHSFNRTLL
jgi:hypothetical protein